MIEQNNDRILPEEEFNRIKAKIEEIIPNPKCPMCHNTTFIIVEGYKVISLQSVINHMTLEGHFIPAVILACSKCGFISTHSLGLLGLLDIKTKK